MVKQTSNEINLSDVVAVLRQHRRVLFLTPVVLILCAIIYLHVTDPEYAVALKVTPTASATSTLPSGLSGLAGLTGLSIPNANETIDFELYLEGLQSRETSAAVTEDSELLKQLFPEQWDSEAQEWAEPSGLLISTSALLKAIFGVSDGTWRPPAAPQVNEFLNEELRIARDRNGPVVTIMIEHSRPEVAQALLSVLHETVDSALRQKELDRTSSYVAYLKDQLANISVTDYRQALHDILAEQEKRRMVASSNLPFAAEPFGRPTVSVRPTSPRPVLTVFSSLLFGILLGIVAALSLHQFRRQASKKA
jgi:uncharacterized protein involved in exopolysaccharide biosynthesis